MVFDDLKIISNVSIDLNDPTDFDDPQNLVQKERQLEVLT